MVPVAGCGGYYPRRLSDYPCAGCKSGCLAQISASFRPIAMAMSSQMSQNRVSNFQIFASARIVRQPPRFKSLRNFHRSSRYDDQCWSQIEPQSHPLWSGHSFCIIKDDYLSISVFATFNPHLFCGFLTWRIHPRKMT